MCTSYALPLVNDAGKIIKCFQQSILDALLYLIITLVVTMYGMKSLVVTM